MSQLLSKVTSALSSDIVFLAFLFLVFFICVMYFGKNKMATMLIVFYPAVFVFGNIPFLSKLVFMSGERGVLLSKFIVFVAVFALIYFAVNKYFITFNEPSGFLRKAGLSLGLLIAFVVFSYKVVSLDFIHNFSGSVDTIITGGNREFWWGIAPLAILAFF